LRKRTLTLLLVFCFLVVLTGFSIVVARIFFVHLSRAPTGAMANTTTFRRTFPTFMLSLRECEL